jgi:hypothetical protein
MLRDRTIDVQHLGIVDAVPRADRVGGNITERRIAIRSPDQCSLLQTAMHASENCWASLAFDCTRVLQDSWGCEGTM